LLKSSFSLMKKKSSVSDIKLHTSVFSSAFLKKITSNLVDLLRNFLRIFLVIISFVLVVLGFELRALCLLYQLLKLIFGAN
jgi:hypothetical protein